MVLGADRRDHGRMELISEGVATDAVRAGASSSAGHRRTLNEDAHLCGPTWFAVADGMGGHQAGDVASSVAIESLRSRPALSDVAELSMVVTSINEEIRAIARRDGTSGMGTTLVVAAPIGDGLAVAHIGDSRCYRLVGGVLMQLTHDHSHVQELVDLGHLTREEARHHRHRNLITRALGIDAIAQADTMFIPAPVGRVLLCSDGLSTELGPRAIGRVLAGVDDPQAAADRLVELTLRSAAIDNVTAVVVDTIGATT